ncbi:MAG: MlaD family protein [Bacteroidales bacterium]|nr:MlaD family protein [Bacteroidales bacterium]
MKKLSSELKIGAIAIIIIVLFIWVFNFLRGRNILSNSDHYIAYYSNIAGLGESSPVEMNGLKIGVVQQLAMINDGTGLIKVNMSVNDGILIPIDSRAEITTATLIAGMKINLILGKSMEYLSPGDTIQGYLAESIIDKIGLGMDPIIAKTSILLERLDTIGEKISTLFSDEFSSNIKSTVANIDMAGNEFKSAIAENRKELSELINNLNSISKLIDNNGAQLDSTLDNIHYISERLTKSDIDTALISFSSSLKESQLILQGINSGKGSAGKLMNDDSLYVNLSRSLESLNLLLKDMEKNPGRYLHFSVFGSKKK